jgi:hypothetical protein
VEVQARQFTRNRQPEALCEGISIRLGQSATAPSRATQSSAVAELARFFPDATPVRIPIHFTRMAGANGENQFVQAAQESTVIEYGTPREVLFACAMPLEFADVLRLRNSDGSLDAEASVVAVQYHPRVTAVAARFRQPVANWIVKP